MHMHLTRTTCGQELAAHLLHEISKGQQSAWRLYLPTLPRSYTTLACFSERAAAQLQEQAAVSCALAARRAALLSWRRMQPLLLELGADV